jgi:hypothetical protein
MTNQTGCGGVYTLAGTPNPSLGTFLSDEWASFQAINAALAGLPQPKIPVLTGQILPANGSFLLGNGDASVAAYGPYITAYMAQMKAMGIATQDWFGQTTAMAAAVQCNSSNYNCSVPTDCGGGGYLALNAPLPSGSGPYCTALHDYDLMFQYAAANGITIRGGFPQDAPQVTACGLTPNPGVITEAQFEACILPLTKAEFARWGAAIARYQVVIEPVAGMSGIQQFSVSDTALIIKNFSTAIKAISPSVKIGAAATGQSYPILAAPGTDLCYWQDWASTTQLNSACASAATNTYQYLDYLNLDVFNGTSDQSGNAYANELQWFQQNYLSAAGNARNFPVYVGQADPPRWAFVSAHPTEGNAYLGCLDDIWNTSGLRPLWQKTFVSWASASGIQSVSLYFTIPWFGATANQSADNCQSGAVASAMASLAPNANAAAWAALGGWWTASMQSNAHLTGRSHLGR